MSKKAPPHSSPQPPQGRRSGKRSPQRPELRVFIGASITVPEGFSVSTRVTMRVKKTFKKPMHSTFFKRTYN